MKYKSQYHMNKYDPLLEGSYDWKFYGKANTYTMKRTLDVFI